MRLTTKGRFAVTAMIDLAMRQKSGPVTLSEISARQDISLSYLEQLFGKLRRVNIVQSTRGPGGGYSLREMIEQSLLLRLSLLWMNQLTRHSAVIKEIVKANEDIRGSA
jgi:Rrf2 family protein